MSVNVYSNIESQWDINSQIFLIIDANIGENPCFALQGLSQDYKNTCLQHQYSQISACPELATNLL